MRLEILSNDGDVLIRRDLLRFADNLAVPMAALEGAATVMRHATEDQFATEGRHASGGWAPLAASTIQEKARRGLSPQILQASGRLMASLVDRFSPDHIERLSETSVAFGSNVPYGIFHKTGTRKMPARPPIALSEADKVLIVKVMQAALLAGVKAGSASSGLSALQGLGVAA